MPTRCVLCRQELVPDLIRNFEKKIFDTIKNKDLPITPELVEQRIKETTFVLDDALYATLEEYWGQFDVETGFVAISEDVPAKRLSKVFTHEMFHALSGRTSLAEKGPDLPPDWPGMMTHQRVGTHFRSDSPFRGEANALSSFSLAE